MLATDWDFLLTDLARLGMTSAVQIERRAKTGRTPRGVAAEQVVPVGSVIDVLLTDKEELLQITGFGSSTGGPVAAFLPPGTECTERDELAVSDGFQAGKRFRVLHVRKVPGDAGALAAALEEMTP